MLSMRPLRAYRSHFSKWPRRWKWILRRQSKMPSSSVLYILVLYVSLWRVGIEIAYIVLDCGTVVGELRCKCPRGLHTHKLRERHLLRSLSCTNVHTINQRLPMLRKHCRVTCSCVCVCSVHVYSWRTNIGNRTSAHRNPNTRLRLNERPSNPAPRN